MFFHKEGEAQRSQMHSTWCKDMSLRKRAACSCVDWQSELQDHDIQDGMDRATATAGAAKRRAGESTAVEAAATVGTGAGNVLVRIQGHTWVLRRLWILDESAAW